MQTPTFYLPTSTHKHTNKKGQKPKTKNTKKGPKKAKKQKKNEKTGNQVKTHYNQPQNQQTAYPNQNMDTTFSRLEQPASFFTATATAQEEKEKKRERKRKADNEFEPELEFDLKDNAKVNATFLHTLFPSRFLKRKIQHRQCIEHILQIERALSPLFVFKQMTKTETVWVFEFEATSTHPNKNPTKNQNQTMNQCIHALCSLQYSQFEIMQGDTQIRVFVNVF